MWLELVLPCSSTPSTVTAATHTTWSSIVQQKCTAGQIDNHLHCPSLDWRYLIRMKVEAGAEQSPVRVGSIHEHTHTHTCTCTCTKEEVPPIEVYKHKFASCFGKRLIRMFLLRHNTKPFCETLQISTVSQFRKWEIRLEEYFSMFQTNVCPPNLENTYSSYRPICTFHCTESL